MQYYVLDTSYNWADEMDLDHYTVVDEDTLRDYKNDLKKVPDNYEYATCIGSNEEQYFTKDNIECMLETAVRISESDMKVLQKYVSQCDEDPICEFLQSYYEEQHDEDNDNIEDEEDITPDEEIAPYKAELYEAEPDLKDGEIKVMSDTPEQYGLTEGVVVYDCYLYGKPWFANGKRGWYKSFKSTVHWDINGLFVYPNDDPTREKYYKFGASSKTRLNPII